jgi:hypothetical protein
MAAAPHFSSTHHPLHYFTDPTASDQGGLDSDASIFGSTSVTVPLTVASVDDDQKVIVNGEQTRSGEFVPFVATAAIAR